MAARGILGPLVLWLATLETLRSETSTTRYLVWGGSHIGQDSFLNIWDGSITTEDSGSCKVSFNPVGTSIQVCVTVEKFHIEDCNATVNYYHYDDSERKATYGCNTTPGSFCWTGNGVEVEIAYKGKSPPGSSNYFQLKITQYEKEDWFTLTILAPFVGVAIIVAIIMVVVCRRKRTNGVVFRNSEIPHFRLDN